MAQAPREPIKDEDLLADAIPIEALDEDALAQPRPAAEHEQPEAIDLAESTEAREIRTFETRKRHDDKWQRKPNVTGQGAIHVKTFVSKLRLDAVDNMDNQINEWLDSHPEYEVKLVTTQVGALTGKTTEPALFVLVWV